jgi:hypothetical protein
LPAGFGVFVAVLDVFIQISEHVALPFFCVERQPRDLVHNKNPREMSRGFLQSSKKWLRDKT